MATKKSSKKTRARVVEHDNPAKAPTGDVPPEWPLWLRLPRDFEAQARMIVAERQHDWDRASQSSRKLLESWDHHRPDSLLVDRARELAEAIAGALYTGRRETLDRMLEAIDPKRSVELARYHVAELFVRALTIQPNGTIGKASQGAALILLNHLPSHHVNFRRLTIGNLATLLRKGRLSEGRRRNTKVGAFLLAAEASTHCGAFGDDGEERSVDQAKEDFRKAYEKFCRKL